jgi:deazaflavin-dependent oxidoreductase (nitroreductase family)
VASIGGAATHPHRYHNIVANPVVGVEYGTEEFQARAEVVPEPDRTELYERIKSMMASFYDYKVKTSRVIPVVTLTRL